MTRATDELKLSIETYENTIDDKIKNSEKSIETSLALTDTQKESQNPSTTRTYSGSNHDSKLLYILEIFYKKNLAILVAKTLGTKLKI